MRVKATIYAPSGSTGQSTGLSASRGVLQDEECPVLHLVLGPHHLDLLGLIVDLNKVVLDIKAIPGTLLGNIFCQLVTPPRRRRHPSAELVRRRAACLPAARRRVPGADVGTLVRRSTNFAKSLS
jgi:hypothetical protein